MSNPQLCEVLPVGRELLASILAFKEFGSCTEARDSLLSIFLYIHSSSIEELESQSRREHNGNYSLIHASEWKKCPPLLCCWTKLLRSVDSNDVLPVYLVEAVGALSSGALRYCMEGENLNMDRVAAVKFLFGVPYDMSEIDGFPEENMNYIQELTTLIGSNMSVDDEYSAASDMNTILDHAKESVKSLSLLLQKPLGSVKSDVIISSIIPFSPSDVPVSSKIRKIADGSAERVENYNLGGFGDKFYWECPENLRERLSQAALPLKRKTSSLEGTNRHPRGENVPAETMSQSSFSRGSGLSSAPPGPTRRDTFRQRKPNTSRPPSMHVDDYVARERNVDGSSSTNVIAIPRVGSTSGRPPSIHVDEFMARQRERQNPAVMAVSNAASQVKTAPPENDTDSEKFSKSKQLKPDLDDDLQGIDIVFDGEESESDDKLPFPQPDDNLQQPASVIVEPSSPRSIVEETESDANESSQFSHLGTPLASNVDGNTNIEFSSRISASRPEMSLTREPSISSDKKYRGQSQNVPVKTSNGFDSAVMATSSGLPASVYNKPSGPSVHLPNDSRMPPPNFYNSPQRAGIAPSIGSQGFYDQKFQPNQPPLPPMPPPPTISPVPSQTPDLLSTQSSPFVHSMVDVQPPLPPGFHVHSEYPAALSISSTSAASSSPLPDSKYARTSLSSPGGSARPPPPLPPTPPPYSANPSTFPSLRTPASQASVYSQTNAGATELLHTSVASSSDARLGNLSASGAILTPYPLPPLMPPLLFNRPASVPISLYGSSPSLHPGENPSNTSQNLPIPLPSIHSLQSLGQLQPLQPPQLPRPPQPPQHLRPPISASSQAEQGVSLLQNSVPVQVQQLQILQQPQVSPIHVYYQPQQDNFSHTMQQQVEQPRPQVLHQQGDEQSDSGMSLQHFFSSPEAIQSLLGDRDKLCQLLEQHPKLMQMLQERLGQL
ncbi:unnamed protein product [Ilex paraguariensis]|uniref:Uncharacterized protein n=1 Tax=Ilex paraguariensis TaxID=185542 RepID=A0ABC8R7Z4_9AQUA